MLLTVTDVEYLGDYVLLCTFNDGVGKRPGSFIEISGI